MRLPRSLILALLALVAATGLPAAAAPADASAAAKPAKRGPCFVGVRQPRCWVSRGTVPYQANDGDTIDVRLDGAARGERLTRVRLAGVQAMELTSYKQRAGDCLAVEAAQRLDALLDAADRRVRLAALDSASVSRRRALRSVMVKVDGEWVDVGRTLIGEGLALWVSFSREWAVNAGYSQEARSAQLRGAGLWAPDRCGPGPNPGAALRVWASSNPDGEDRYALDDEYVTVRNEDWTQTVDLSGWWVRDTSLARYTFPPGTVLAPGQHVTVHVGPGDDTATDRYWGLRKPIFNNASSGESAKGDGGYLFDPYGNLRAGMIYPCRVECTDRLTGALAIEAKPEGEEVVTVRNLTSAPVDLFGYRLYTRPYQYAFPAGTVIQPGGTLRVGVGGYPEDDEPERKYWGLPDKVLRNAGDRVALQTFDEVQLACTSWGDRVC